MALQRLLVVGAGGHGRSVAEAAFFLGQRLCGVVCRRFFGSGYAYSPPSVVGSIADLTAYPA